MSEDALCSVSDSIHVLVHVCIYVCVLVGRGNWLCGSKVGGRWF